MKIGWSILNLLFVLTKKNTEFSMRTGCSLLIRLETLCCLSHFMPFWSQVYLFACERMYMCTHCRASYCFFFVFVRIAIFRYFGFYSVQTPRYFFFAAVCILYKHQRLCGEVRKCTWVTSMIDREWYSECSISEVVPYFFNYATYKCFIIWGVRTTEQILRKRKDFMVISSTE